MFNRLQNVLKEETEGYSSAKALMEAPVVGTHLQLVLQLIVIHKY